MLSEKALTVFAVATDIFAQSHLNDFDDDNFII